MNSNKYIENQIPKILKDLIYGAGIKVEDKHRTLVILEHNVKKLVENLALSDVVKSSDLWVVEFSDNEIKLMTSKELQDYEDECMKFDGFMGCSVLGRLAKSK